MKSLLIALLMLGVAEVFGGGSAAADSLPISPEGGGLRLKLRGFLGVSLLGRTQYWLRIVEPRSLPQPLSQAVGH